MIDASELKQALEASIAEQVASPVTVSDLILLAGGSSQETWRFDLAIASGAQQGQHRLILRRPLGGSIFTIALDLSQEYQVLSAAAAGGVPSPRPYWLLQNLLGGPATIVERLEGEGIGRKIVRDPKLAQARANLPAQMGAALAALHKVDYRAYGLDQLLTSPAAGQTPAQARMALIEAELDDISEPHPVLELGLRWLRHHEPPPPARLVLIHGDFRVGNVLVNPSGLVALIDWEFSHIGDYAEDLSYPLVREWRFGVDQLQLGGIAQPEKYLEAYQQHGDLPADPERVFYWELMGNVWWAVGLLKQTQRHLRGLEPNLEFACLGRRCAEMEFEILNMLQVAASRSSRLAQSYK